jgi:hypothetical protein
MMNSKSFRDSLSGICASPFAERTNFVLDIIQSIMKRLLAVGAEQRSGGNSTRGIHADFYCCLKGAIHDCFRSNSDDLRAMFIRSFDAQFSVHDLRHRDSDPQNRSNGVTFRAKPFMKESRIMKKH